MKKDHTMNVHSLPELPAPRKSKKKVLVQAEVPVELMAAARKILSANDVTIQAMVEYGIRRYIRDMVDAMDPKAAKAIGITIEG